FGPKRIVMIGSLLQAVAVFLLVFCTTLNQLMVIEVIIGLSFPIIYGADSKWIIANKGDEKSEYFNQSLLWISQLVSAFIGCLLINTPEIGCYLSSFLYLIGFILAYFTKDINRKETVFLNFSISNFKQLLTKISPFYFFIFIIALGVASTSSWVFQMFALEVLEKSEIYFGIIQISAALFSLLGNFFAQKLNRLPRKKDVYFLGLILILYIISFTVFNFLILNLILLCIILIIRGAINAITKVYIVNKASASDPIAIWMFFVNGGAKVFQTLTLVLLGSFM
ncbi:hypothetical protein, partial [Tenacibaculum finnmarkense]